MAQFTSAPFNGVKTMWRLHVLLTLHSTLISSELSEVKQMQLTCRQFRFRKPALPQYLLLPRCGSSFPQPFQKGARSGRIIQRPTGPYAVLIFSPLPTVPITDPTECTALSVLTMWEARAVPEMKKVRQKVVTTPYPESSLYIGA